MERLFAIFAVLLLLASAVSVTVDATEPVVGGDRDEHGCILSAGYSWCESKQKCLRTWEEDCGKTIRFEGIFEKDPGTGYNPSGCGYRLKLDDGSTVLIDMSKIDMIAIYPNPYLGKRVVVKGYEPSIVSRMCPYKIVVTNIKVAGICPDTPAMPRCPGAYDFEYDENGCVISFKCPWPTDDCKQGCSMNGACYADGARKDNFFCSVNEWENQKPNGDSCDENYQCKSNFCSNTTCLDIGQEFKETKGLLQRICIVPKSVNIEVYSAA